ncbi:hypothetical protein [Mycobacteroides abscessus]|uniref:hypothetical protein n=1 Tax=Mycobacteroides abscessus TaxID=36809 RepID=UPI0005E8BD34|nr:hypothetical protein [Mycobacteroides abscessus]CPR79104.1 Uncharacterised protein [Mycobacteroides abscessus]CPR88270.1 Uncharacterised protein [Mycobacteroides abscessus]CPS43228.1 Uncharacterised protein [Mycobacteroides abscessus]CPV03011.1 Uncharacterised protein [Mycobacteroides abscessus]
MSAMPAHQRAVNDAQCAMGNKITAHSGDPGVNLTANLIATTPASANTAWPASTDGAGADAGYAVSVGSPVTFQGPASTVVSHYVIWNGSTPLRGKALDTPITIGGSPVNFDITPKTRFKGGQ